jgi:predicted nuclease of restriction endonuclease-like RecB superfamily
MPFARDEAELRQLLTGTATRIIGDATPVEPALCVARPTTQDPYASKLERRYAETFLAPSLTNGDLKAWWYEPMSLRLGKGCFYTPDFLLQDANDRLIVDETKGYWREAARVRIKIAAQRYPCFTFRGVRWVNGVWRYEEF